MTLPNFIPKGYRSMIVSSRPANEGDDDLLESEHQHEAGVQNQFKGDKIRAVKQVASRIDKTKDFLKKTKKDSKAQKLLQKQLENLEQEQFELLRDEILNLVKDSAGGINWKKLARFPGSSAFIQKHLKKNKTLIEKEKDNDRKDD